MSVLVVFTAQLKEGTEEPYLALSRKVIKYAHWQPGLLSMERGRSVITERGIISISEWKSEEALQTWKEHPVHRQAQEIAVKELFESYSLKKANIIK